MWSEFSEKTDPTRRVRQSLRACEGNDGAAGGCVLVRNACVSIE